MVGVKNIVSFVQRFLYFFPVFCFSGPQIRLITKGKKGGTGGESAFKTIPFAVWNKSEYQGHDEASTKKKREKSPNEDVEISACEENWQKKSF